jgi:hypothetical protein
MVNESIVTKLLVACAILRTHLNITDGTFFPPPALVECFISKFPFINLIMKSFCLILVVAGTVSHTVCMFDYSP